MEVLVLVLLIGAIVALWSVAVAALVSALRQPTHVWAVARRSRGGTIAGIILTGGFGGLLYFLRIRPALVVASERVPPPPRSDPWSSNDGW